MLFMVIERFRDNDVAPMCQRLQESGRSLPGDYREGFVACWCMAHRVEPLFRDGPYVVSRRVLS
jgi:hypothetical protein